MRKYNIIFFILLLALIVKCTTTQYKSEYQQTSTEIDNILQHDQNLTPSQKVVLNHAKIELKTAQTQDKQIFQLQKKVISESKMAGAGTLVYWLIGLGAVLAVAYVSGKFLKIF